MRWTSFRTVWRERRDLERRGLSASSRKRTNSSVSSKRFANSKNRSTFATASGTVSPRPFASTGRVATARYSRKIWPLRARWNPCWLALEKIRYASRCDGLKTSVAVKSTFVSTKRISPTIASIDLVPSPRSRASDADCCKLQAALGRFRRSHLSSSFQDCVQLALQ